MPGQGSNNEEQTYSAVPTIGRRLLGWSIDYALMMLVAVLAVGLALSLLFHSLAGYAGAVTANVGWSYLVRLIAHGGDIRFLGEVHTAASEEWFTFVTPLIIALVAVPVAQFVYQWTLLAWRGCTLGKMVADTQVLRDGSSPRLSRRQALRRAAITTASETGLIGLALIAITLGQLAAGIIVWAIAVVLFWSNAFAAMIGRRRTIADRLAGTSVFRVARYAQLAQRTVEFAHMTSDAAVVTGQLTREGVQTIGRSGPVQQVLAAGVQVSDQAQVFGLSSVDRARELGKQTKSKARRLGGVMQQRWDEQRAHRTQHETDTADESTED